MSLTQNDYLTFLQYWKQTCEASDGKIAERHLFRPSGIAYLLPHVFLLEVIPPEMLEVRIAGTALDMLSAKTLTGNNFLDVCPPHERDIYWDVMQEILRVPCGSMITREVTFRDDQTYTMKSLKFPLIDKSAGRQFIVGLLGITNLDQTMPRPKGGAARSKITDQHYVDVGYGAPQSHSTTTE
ncbi:PAS domain-containing protein [Kordiimonas aquimaris]|uniref:PAS domain-containing protein n=1 Tax=Kordiimonas aquimaris TaxID=707591 RepID=UPI0021D0FF08|nr:PAS domain-containing protein [Kordiimonas aquimaris]